MKKFSIIGILLFAFLASGYVFIAQQRPFTSPAKAAPSPKFEIGSEQSKNGTGKAVLWHMVNEDEYYLFVTDKKRRPKQPLLLCRMNYSIQGSFDPKWSNDKQMVAVYQAPHECCPDDEEWITGYDWKTGKVLKSKEIPHALTIHKGVGESCEIHLDRSPSVEEIKQYKPERLSR